MPKLLEKTERRLGEKLFIKGERCIGPKCAFARRAYPPGAHGKKRARKREASGFASLLNQKQKLRFIYGLDDKDIARYSTLASSKRGIFGALLIEFLEKRLDNIIFRIGFAESRRAARQRISHGHVLVNGRTVRIPSYSVGKTDEISLKEKILHSPLYAGFGERLKKNSKIPKWLLLDPQKQSAKVVGTPEEADAALPIDITKIKEFYSR
ncbi:MAG: small subunit ribosomal protein S4 [Parcubacteria group bacterium Gr01-1014_33]|nr:MAG: small subunit ribosomal protein S4 [Parcubacteria group bacterium Gr01-1014_33]